MSDLTPRTAGAIVIGNELLSGKIPDQNVYRLAQTLRSMGIALRQVVMIPDEVPLIVEQVKAFSQTYDEVFTSGGIGPTHDDLTISAIAQAFNTPVEFDQKLVQMIEKHFGEQLRPGHLLMARVPQGCELVATAEMPWPTVRMKNVWVLPGVPEIFRMRLTQIKRHLAQSRPFLSRAVYTNMDEGDLVPLLDAVVARFPQVEVGSYPKWNDPTCRTMLTFDGLEPDQVNGAFEAFIASLPQGEPLRTS